MRHRKAGIKLNRTTSHRDAMFRNMVTSLFKYDRIRTTDVKAKELKRWADNLVTLAKRGDLHARRQAMAIIREKAVVHKLFAEAGERFGSIVGGYTRIVKLGRRPGDAAPISLIELTAIQIETGKKKKKEKKGESAKKTVQEKKAVLEAPAAKAPAAKPNPITDDKPINDASDQVKIDAMGAPQAVSEGKTDQDGVVEETNKPETQE
jgi:large subunit ribosomal protein L17